MEINFNKVHKGEYLSKENSISLARIKEEEKYDAMLKRLKGDESRDASSTSLSELLKGFNVR